MGGLPTFGQILCSGVAKVVLPVFYILVEVKAKCKRAAETHKHLPPPTNFTFSRLLDASPSTIPERKPPRAIHLHLHVQQAQAGVKEWRWRLTSSVPRGHGRRTREPGNTLTERPVWWAPSGPEPFPRCIIWAVHYPRPRDHSVVEVVVGGGGPGHTHVRLLIAPLDVHCPNHQLSCTCLQLHLGRACLQAWLLFVLHTHSKHPLETWEVYLVISSLREPIAHVQYLFFYSHLQTFVCPNAILDYKPWQPLSWRQ